MKVFAIGHSNHDILKFISLLKDAGIELLVDVRSSPYSRYVPHFNKNAIEASLKREGIEYLYMGDRLGGKPTLGVEKLSTYYEITQNESFQEAIGDLLEVARKMRLALMCAEKDPNKCHRKHLISPELKKRGVDVIHILSDSTTVGDEDTDPPTLFREG